MILKSLAFACSLSFATLTSLQAFQITNFGSDSFDLDLAFSSIPTTSSASSLSVHGQDNPHEYLYGNLLTPVTLSDLSTLELTASLSSAYSYVPFTLTLYDSDFGEIAQYFGDAGAFGSSLTTITLTLNPDFPLSESSMIAGIMFYFEDTTDTGFTMTLTNLEAIPEPGVPLLIGFGVAAAVLLRWRRRAADAALAA